MHILWISSEGCIQALMGLFANRKAFDRLEDRLQRTEQLCADLDRQSKKLDLEFTDLYDKVRRQMSRMANRYAVDQKENGELLEDPPEIPGGPETDSISAAIHARRGRGFLTP